MSTGIGRLVGCKRQSSLKPCEVDFQLFSALGVPKLGPQGCNPWTCGLTAGAIHHAAITSARISQQTGNLSTDCSRRPGICQLRQFRFNASALVVCASRYLGAGRTLCN